MTPGAPVAITLGELRAWLARLPEDATDDSELAILPGAYAHDETMGPIVLAPYVEGRAPTMHTYYLALVLPAADDEYPIIVFDADDPTPEPPRLTLVEGAPPQEP